MRVLVTGASGFIGSNLLERLCNLKNIVILATSRTKGVTSLRDVTLGRLNWLQLNLTCDYAVQEMYEIFEPTHIFHLASSASGADWTHTHTRDLDSLFTLLKYCESGTRFIHGSSVVVYGNYLADNPSEHCPCEPTNLYGWSKWAAEKMVQLHAKKNGLSYQCLRLIAQTGRHATHGLVCDIVKKLLNKNPTLDLIGQAPGTSKPIMHVTDTVNALCHFGFGSHEGIVNVSTPDNISVQDVAAIIMDTLQISKPIRWIGQTWAGDNMFVKIDTERALQQGWRLKYTNEEAVYYGCMDNFIQLTGENP